MPIPLVTRILIADDFPIVRSGLRKVLDAKADLEVVAEAEDGHEAVEKALEEDVDLVILDVSMPRMTGIQAAAELHKRKPELKVLMLSMHDSEQFLFEALKAGASGYVLKSGADTDIVDAVRAAMRGDSFLYPSAGTTLVRDYVERGGQGEEQGQRGSNCQQPQTDGVGVGAAVHVAHQQRRREPAQPAGRSDETGDPSHPGRLGHLGDQGEGGAATRAQCRGHG